MTVVNTDPKCYWLTNYLETLLVQVWYPMTVATNSREHKKIIASYFDKTGCSRAPAASAFLSKLVDFGFRGVSSVETAALGGAAHLCNFRATDTLAGIQMLKAYYNELDGNFIMPGNSIPAAEHSTITSWGRERESDALRNMLEQYPTGLVAVVSDSYNIYEACENKWGKELKSMIENRDGTLIVRPDSGEPKIIVVEVLEILGKAFGTSVNEKGYKMLPEYIRVIQGDGISYETLSEILENMVANQWAADNVTFGSGGALLQKLNRDTQKCAFKCSELRKADGSVTLVYKDPITDKGKQSKKGRMTVEKGADGKLTTVTEGKGDPAKDVMHEVFRDGVGAYRHYRIPSLVTTPSNVVLALAEGRMQKNDHGWVDIVLRRSFDGGKTWSPMSVVRTESNATPRVTICNPTPLVDAPEVVLLFNRENAEILLTRSLDDGATWSPPRQISWSRPPEWQWLAVGPPAALRTRAGRWVVPADGFVGRHDYAISKRHDVAASGMLDAGRRPRMPGAWRLGTLKPRAVAAKAMAAV